MTAPRVGAAIRWMAADDPNPMPSPVADLRGFLRAVRIVAAAGLPAPAEFDQVCDRYLQLTGQVASGTRPMRDRLLAAVFGADDDLELAALLALARAEENPASVEVLQDAENQVFGRLREIHATVVVGHYATLAARFNDAAAGFTRAADIVDPAVDPGRVITGHPRLQQAWHDAEARARELDELLEPLASAAELLRGPHAPSGIGHNGTDALLLPLVVADPTDHHRRRLWHCWWDLPEPPRNLAAPLTVAAMQAPPAEVVGTRAGRWTRLWALDAEIAACANPVSLELYAPPPPYATRINTRTAKPTPERFDPCDEEHDPAAPRNRRRWLATALKRRRGDTQPDEADNILDSVLDATDGLEVNQ